MKMPQAYFLFLFFLFFNATVPVSSSAQTTESPEAAVASTELDQWKGSSLGIRLDVDGPIPEITDVYPHVQESSLLRTGDQIMKIGELVFPGATMDDLAALLEKTDPGTSIDVAVNRKQEELLLEVETLRKEFVDIHAIHRRLSRNRIIEDHLENTNRPDLLENFTTRMSDAVKSSKSPREASEALNRIIDEIGVSHTAIVPASAGLTFSSKSKGSLGLVLQRHYINGRQGYFVVDKKPGSSSFDSDLLIGDEIVAVNGVPISESRRLDLSGHEDRYQLFTLVSDVDEELEIEFFRSPFDDVEMLRLRTQSDPNTVNSVRSSAKIIHENNLDIGYMRFWNLMSMGVNTELSKKLKGEFANCDALILDLRGRGGIVPAVLALNRSIKKVEKPVVIIIDGLTRSAKEMLAYLVKKHEHVLVVGSKTSGAVTGATMTKLPSGNSLMFPVASAESLKQFIDGTIIEGVGVEPDERVEFFIPYCGGNDKIFNFAIKRAEEMATQKKAIQQSSIK